MTVIDNIGGCQSEVKVWVDDTLYTGWVNAKPINPRWFRTRIADAWQILRGKAIAVRYFDDLNEKEKANHVKKYMKTQ